MRRMKFPKRLRKQLERACNYAVLFGLNPKKFVRSCLLFPGFVKGMREFKRQIKTSGQTFYWGSLEPCLYDRRTASGRGAGAYFAQDLLVARRIFSANPRRHIDVGSRVDGFVAHVASFREIEVIDIRPPPGSIDGITYVQMDMMGTVPAELRQCCDSLSCLHALEHFGLGRYGDPICFNGHLKGLDNLRLLLRKGGRLYLSMPIGGQRINFNCHRVFAVSSLLGMVKQGFEIQVFSYIDDNGRLHKNVELNSDSVEANFGCNCGCAVIELIRTDGCHGEELSTP